MSQRREPPELTPEMLLRAYAIGIFPMAESREDPDLCWLDPEMRGILPLEAFHVSRSLRKLLRRGLFRITCDQRFTAVVAACAAPAPGRRQSWINETIAGLCDKLFALGHAHSVEVWQGDSLVGGVYGIACNGAFFGESMFSRVRNASKVALVHLAARLLSGGFTLLDAQFVSNHLRQFGAIEIPRAEYRQRLARAIATPARFYGELPVGALEALLTQSRIQRS